MEPNRPEGGGEGKTVLPPDGLLAQACLNQEFRAAPTTAVGLSVFVAHEDLDAGLRARLILNNLGARFILRQAFNAHWWRFELLEDAKLREEALWSARQTDILFVAVRGDRLLPPGVCHWINHWLSTRDDRPCTMVVSFDFQHRDSGTGRQTLEYLRNATVGARIEMFTHFGPISPLDRPAATRAVGVG